MWVSTVRCSSQYTISVRNSNADCSLVLLIQLDISTSSGCGRGQGDNSDHVFLNVVMYMYPLEQTDGHALPALAPTPIVVVSCVDNIMSGYMSNFSPKETVLNCCGRTSGHQFLAVPEKAVVEAWYDWRECLHPPRIADARGCRLGAHVHIQPRILTRCQLQSPRPPEKVGNVCNVLLPPPKQYGVSSKTPFPSIWYSDTQVETLVWQRTRNTR